MVFSPFLAVVPCFKNGYNSAQITLGHGGSFYSVKPYALCSVCWLVGSAGSWVFCSSAWPLTMTPCISVSLGPDLSLLYFQSFQALILWIQGSTDASLGPCTRSLLILPGKLFWKVQSISHPWPGLISILLYFFKRILDFSLQQAGKGLSQSMAGSCDLVIKSGCVSRAWAQEQSEAAFYIPFVKEVGLNVCQSS